CSGSRSPTGSRVCTGFPTTASSSRGCSARRCSTSATSTAPRVCSRRAARGRAIRLGGGQLGVLAGAYARTLDHVYSFETLVVLPLGFLGGIFYSVSQLPPAWHDLSEVNPVFYIVQALRIGFLGSGDIPAGVALGVLW